MNRRLDKRGAEGEWRRSSLEFNRWLRENGERAGMTVLDATHLTPEESAAEIHKWIMARI